MRGIERVCRDVLSSKERPVRRPPFCPFRFSLLLPVELDQALLQSHFWHGSRFIVPVLLVHLSAFPTAALPISPTDWGGFTT
jgi:hypothetical protein